MGVKTKDIPSDELVFYCNGRKIVEPNPDPQMSLNTYLRYTLWLPGTKKSCAEGGCGACTAMLSYYDTASKNIRHLAVNTCVTPLCSVHHMAVTTVEGIGSSRSKLHPVQERIAEAHGTQCGFCTPGFVMSMYALLRNNPQPSKEEVDAALVGNLCRCTGYRPIVEAFQTFTKDCCGGGSDQSGCCRNSQPTSEEENLRLANQLYRTEDWIPYDPSQDIIFPPELQLLNEGGTQSVAFTRKDSMWFRPATLQELLDLMTKYPEGKITVGNISIGTQSVAFTSKDSKWFRPATLQELLNLMTKYPEGKITVGNISIGLAARYTNVEYPIMLCASRVPELLQLQVVDDGIFVGSAVTMTELLVFLQAQVDKLPEMKTRFHSALVGLLKKLSGVQIRNVASVGGNIMAEGATSDLRTIFMAASCSLHIASSTASRKVTLEPSFYSEGNKPKLDVDEVLLGILLPFTGKDEYFCSFKQSSRKGNDAAIVNAAMRVKFIENSDLIEDLSLVFVGFASSSKMATNAMAQLKGRRWESSLVDDACALLIKDLSLPQGSPGGMETYKLSLALGFFFKFYLTVTEKRSKEPSHGSLQLSEVTAEGSFQLNSKMAFQSTQLFQDVVEDQDASDSVGRPKAVMSALEHATGEARYVDDMPSAKNELFLAFVRIQSPHAKIMSVDFSEALVVDGVVDVVTAEDVPRKNCIAGQLVFASQEVKFAGQPIAGILATDEATARQAAKLVKVDYQELEFVLTTEDAIEKKRFFPDKLDYKKGDMEVAFNSSDHVLSGEVKVGAQEHFYMETQSALVQPGGEHGEFDVHSSSQNLHNAQLRIAKVLCVSANRIVCHNKRLGGGFGGKGGSAVVHAIRTAVAANKVNRPVRSVLERQEDAVITGHRAAHIAKYKVGFNKSGKLQALDWEVYVNNGPWTSFANLRMYIMLHNLDSAYHCPNVRVRVITCETNIAPTRPMRGAGAAPTPPMVETMMEHVAVTLGRQAEEVRQLNFYKNNDVTHVNVPLTNCTLERCWQLCLQRSEFATRKKAVEDFNRASRWIKRGLSVIPAKYNMGAVKSHAQSSALVHIYLDGAVLVTHGGIEMGQGLYTKMLQIASRTLHVPIERIHNSVTSTNMIPNNAKTNASIGTDFNGPAVKNACEILMQRLEPYMKRNPEGSWEDWVKAAFDDRVGLSATGHYRVPDEYFPTDPVQASLMPKSFYYHCYGVAATEVEVDCLTGDHRLIRTDIVMDVGDSINPAVDIGQVEGAFMQGYGLYVLEDFRMSPQSGELLTKGPGSYKIPLASSIPSIFNVSLLHNSSNPRAIYSSKAVGEPPFLLAASALTAIRDAISSARADEGLTGHFQLDTPAVPERIRLACQDKFTRKIPDPEPGSRLPFFVRP